MLFVFLPAILVVVGAAALEPRRVPAHRADDAIAVLRYPDEAAVLLKLHLVRRDLSARKLRVGYGRDGEWRRPRLATAAESLAALGPSARSSP